MTDAPIIMITGASGGVGRITARLFLEKGWRVGLIGRRADALEETAQGHAQALLLPCDVAAEAGVEAAFTKAQDRWRRIDALFNNAGQGLISRWNDEMSV